jgi:hypothetical protein
MFGTTVVTKNLFLFLNLFFGTSYTTASHIYHFHHSDVFLDPTSILIHVANYVKLKAIRINRYT